MTSFDTWTIGNPEDLETFQRESRQRHEAAFRTRYAPGEDAPGTACRERFIENALERVQQGETFEIWSAADFSAGYVTLFECWTAPAMPAEPDEVMEAMASHPELPF